MSKFSLTREVWKVLKEGIENAFLKKPQDKDEAYAYFPEMVYVPLRNGEMAAVQVKVVAGDIKEMKSLVDKIYKQVTTKDCFEEDGFEIYLYSGNGYGMAIWERGKVKTTLLLTYKVKQKEV